MRTIDFPEANTMFEKPDNWDDEECTGLTAYVGETKHGMYINTLWMPNKEDIEAILDGRPIILCIHSMFMPPVSLFTYNENGEINE